MATGDGAEVGLAVVREAGDPGGWADCSGLASAGWRRDE
jgi:hypothetical protein